jgi:male-specific lethal 1
MVSYCWEQQAVVRRVHAALVERGYTVWIDIEQMRGSTVESMAAAVENAAGSNR